MIFTRPESRIKRKSSQRSSHSPSLETGSTRARRAFSVAYMEAATRASNGREFSVIFGDGAMAPQAA